MAWLKLTFLRLLFVHFSMVSCTYVATFSNVLFPGIPLNVNIHILNAAGDVTVVAELVKKDSRQVSTVAQTKRVLQTGIPSSLTIDVPDELDGNPQYFVRLSGSGGAVFVNKSGIHLENKNLFVFIQTDKTRYSAGQEIKFRVIHLLPNLMNYKGRSTISIFDGKDNRINVFGPQDVTDGVIVNSLKLSAAPVFGTWKIVVSANNFEEKKTFEVFDYVLPKFIVGIDIPSVKRTDSTLTVNVKARFTFNSDVYGSCKLQIYNEYSTYKYVQYEQQISGSTSFSIPMSRLQSKLNIYDAINVRAIVSDNATALTMVAEEKLTFAADVNGGGQQQPVSIQILEDHESYFVPGIPYYAPVFIGNGDQPFGTKGVINVTSTITTAEKKLCYLNHPPSPWLDVQTTNIKQFTISYDESGYAGLLIPVNNITEKMSVQLSHGNNNINLDLVMLSSGPLEQLRIATSKPHGNVGDKIFLNTEASVSLNGYVLYQIFASGILLKSDPVAVSNAKRHHYEVDLTAAMVPKVQVTATFVTSKGSIMSDYVTLWIDGSPFQNKVDIALNAINFKPGETVNIRVSADPNSTVYMLAEDERNRILGTYNDIYIDEVAKISSTVSDNVDLVHHLGRKRDATMNQLVERREAIRPHYKQGSRMMSLNRNARAGSLFITDVYKTSGVGLITDGKMELGPFQRQFLSESTIYPLKCFLITTLPPGVFPTPRPYPGVTYSPGRFPTYLPGMVPTPAPGRTYAPYSVTLPPPGLTLGEVVRSRFPETWIWDSYKVDATGVININKQVPDSITSWVISTMATNPTTGFGITETKPKITVKKDFFVTMDLPSSIIQGEEFLLQVTVFNYFPIQQQVFLQIESSDNPNKPIPSATIVEPNKGHSTYVHFTPAAIGTVSIKVRAKAGLFTTTATDMLVKNVTVLPHGVHKTENQQHLVDVSPTSSVFVKNIALANPPNMVNGTRSSKMSVTGDFMIPSIDGLQNLIRMPYGCGEQTMLNFAPDIFITKYLQTVGKLTSSIRSKSQSVLESGYQREMQYRHRDGSFSAFGNRDNSGSSWLTAFVLKCFQQAKEFLKIDQTEMVDGLSWLLSYQRSDGSFYEPGRIIHTAMQAGTSSGIKLTAFILISVLENRHVPVVTHNVDQSIAKGTQYLESRLNEAHDVYTLSLLCYALAKAGSSTGPTCYTKLKNVAILDDDKMYWKASSHVAKRRSLSNRAPSADIEATSYSLLTFMSLGKTSEAFPIVKWLVAQRNPNGGFQSTQDTVISLQALAEFSGNHKASPPGYSVHFNAFGIGFSHTYSTTTATFDVVHSVELPDSLSSVVIQAMGTGSAVIDVAMSYYVSGSTVDDHIGVSVNINKETVNSITVQPCISWKGSSQSGMIVMEVEMPTGFQPDNDQIKTKTVIKRHETSGRHVNLYFDSMQRSSVPLCVDVKLDRKDPVVKSQACHVTVYDYYEPIHQATTRYESGILKSSNICDVCPLCNFCTGGVGMIGVGK